MAKDIPGLSASQLGDNARPVERMREELQTLLGLRGDQLDAALTLRSAIARGLIDRIGNALVGSVTYVNTFPGYTVPDVGALEPDLTPPPTPTALLVSAGFTQVIVEWAAPTYTQGHGHKQTNVYAVKRAPSDTALPTFEPGVTPLVFVAPGALTIVSLPSELNTRWHVWIAFETVDGVESLVPAGGVNGYNLGGDFPTTGQDVGALLAVLTGQIREGQLYAALADPIRKIVKTADDAAEDALAATLFQSFAANSWTVRTTVSAGGRTVSGGIGLLGTRDGAGGPTIDFGVLANRFFIGAPSGDGVEDIIPFAVQTTPTTINGVMVPVGVYMDAAFIKNGTITNAKIGNLTVDDAKITSLGVSKLTAGTLNVGAYAQSTGYVSGSSGWRINGNGTAEFSGVEVRGTIYAGAGLIGGNVIDTSGIQSPGYVAGSDGFRLDASGVLRAFTGGGNVVFDLSALGAAPVLKVGRALTIRANGSATYAGNLSAVTGTFGVVTAGLLRNEANTSGINLNATGSQTFLYAGSGAVRITADGDAYFTKSIASGTWVGSQALIQSRIINVVVGFNEGGEAYGAVRETYYPMVEIVIDTGVIKPKATIYERTLTARIGQVTVSYAPTEAAGQFIGMVDLSAEAFTREPVFSGTNVEAAGQNPYGAGNAALFIRVKAQLSDPNGKTTFNLTRLEWTLDAVG